MTGYEIYTFLICLLMFLLLGGLLTLLLIIIFKNTKKVISLGGEDDKIIKQKEEEKKKKPSTIGNIIDYVGSGLIAVLALGVFLFAIISTPTSISQPVTGQTAQVVKSSSMSYKNENNKYLFENNLNNQFDTFDLVFINALPEENELKLYDIVVYETNGILVIHRIIEIEEPNQYHPDCRYFKTQGDAIDTHDKFPVLYSQMRGIYTGERVHFVGSFILFLQSYPGYICIGLIIAASVVIPLLENHLDKHKNERYQYLLSNNLIPNEPSDKDDIDKQENI